MIRSRPYIIVLLLNIFIHQNRRKQKEIIVVGAVFVVKLVNFDILHEISKFNPCCRRDIRTMAAVFCLSSSRRLDSLQSANGRSQFPAPTPSVPHTSAQSLAVFRQRLKTSLFSCSYPDILIWLTYHHWLLSLFFGISRGPCNNWL